MFGCIVDLWSELGQKKILVGIAVGMLFVLLLAGALWSIINRKEAANDLPPATSVTETEIESEDREETEVISTEIETELESESESEIAEEEDPQSSVGGNMTDQEGTSVDISQVVDKAPTNETQEVTLGIDVSKYQGTIDWKKVAESGVDFAMIRVGYRTLKTGEIIADSNAKYNMQEATKYGIKIGAYFFSTAISKEEAVEEANWVADYIAKYQITYPVVYNCENYEDSENRQYSLTKTQRTDFARAFLDQIEERGYSPMFYASKNEMEGDAKWETSRLQNQYKIWVAQYPGVPYPQTAQSSYTGKHDMWQYTNKGTVPGINKPVDMNVAYFGFKESTGPQDSEKPENVEVDVEAGMNFREVNETVTAKEKTHLRTSPDKENDSNIKHTLMNGEIAQVKAVSGDGKWARVEFNSQTLYAWYNYLTTDLSENENEEQTYEEANGIKTKFMEWNDSVTPVATVDFIRLRKKPTTKEEIAPTEYTVAHGERLERIGVSTDADHTYSKIRYKGQILYCVSRYLEVADEPTETSSEDIQE